MTCYSLSLCHSWLAGRSGLVFQQRERERNVLFNDALNTFYLRLYGVRHMVKDHSDSEKGKPLQPHGLLLSISSKGSFICTIPLVFQQDNARDHSVGLPQDLYR